MNDFSCPLFQIHHYEKPTPYLFFFILVVMPGSELFLQAWLVHHKMEMMITQCVVKNTINLIIPNALIIRPSTNWNNQTNVEKSEMINKDTNLRSNLV